MISLGNLTLAKTHDYCASGAPRLAVVMIHGIASDSGSFAKALEHLEEMEALRDVRFITFDLLGAGKSLQSDELDYDYDEQLKALDNAISELKLDVPLVLVGHSMGTFIVTRYANTHKGTAERLILISAPVYTERDLADPAMEVAMRAFRDVVGAKNREILKEKAFENSIKNIVLDKQNYKNLVELNTNAVLIYGEQDQLIAAFNYPKLLSANANLTAIKTTGRHSVTQDKYSELAKILEEMLKAEQK